MAKKAKRTTAQRRAAAKASWERRRKGLPPLTPPKKKRRRPGSKQPALPAAQALVLEHPTEVVRQVIVTPPAIAYAVAEGDDVFLCFGIDGSLNRQKVSKSTAQKLLRELTSILVR